MKDVAIIIQVAIVTAIGPVTAVAIIMALRAHITVIDWPIATITVTGVDPNCYSSQT